MAERIFIHTGGYVSANIKVREIMVECGYDPKAFPIHFRYAKTIVLYGNNEINIYSSKVRNKLNENIDATFLRNKRK